MAVDDGDGEDDDDDDDDNGDTPKKTLQVGSTRGVKQPSTKLPQ